MASKKNQVKTQSKNESAAISTSGQSFSLFNVIENFLETRATVVFYFLLALSILSGLILFDMRVSIGGDDSTYILRAWDFIKKGAFPFEQGPLYPLMLVPILKIYGINLFALKFLSFIFLNLAFVFTYKALKNRIPYLVLFTLLGFIALNAFYQYFACVTYNEAFFFFVQSIAVYFSLVLIDKSKTEKLNFKLDWKLLLLTGLAYLLVSITKTVAIICVTPLFFYFFLNKKWDYLLGSFVAFIGLKVIYEVGIRAAYGAPALGQFQAMFLVDLYKPQLGYEDFSGMIDRFGDNANTYLSARFLSIVYLRGFIDNRIEIIPQLTWLISFLILGFTILAYLKNKIVFFMSLYVISLIFAVFFGIQAKNTQYRLMIIFVPHLMVIMLFGFYYLSRNFIVTQIFFICFFGYILGKCAYASTQKSVKNFPILKENMNGNRYAGFTPDWVNYLKASEWCGDSLPPNEGILARKNSMSFIYANGREFTAIYQVPAITKDSIVSPDSMVNFVKQYNCKYVVLGQLRANPERNDGQIVNTLNVIMGRIFSKYPEKFKMIHAEGKVEMAEVYEMNF